MDHTGNIIFIMEIIGTIAFASSGALLGIRKRMDVFGVCVLGVITAVGGGLTRDVILGITPPGMFQNPVYTATAMAVSLILFISNYKGRDKTGEKRLVIYDKVMTVFDAIGLGIFTVVGINTAVDAGYNQLFLLTFVGVITGVGGGLLRDIMAQEKPYILTKHVYACASIAGALACAFLIRMMNRLPATVIGAAVVISIRMLAAHYHWNLPRVNRE
ncbi:MAG: trimeric intracellular cation channel family protein [Eubacteriales bacterium]|nr:trimeric intracellular cation channel family protein [Eubacteriales bacterium]